MLKMNGLFKKLRLSAYVIILAFSLGISQAHSNGSDDFCSSDRKSSLLQSDDRVGFAQYTAGGKNSTSYTRVSNTNDAGPGSLREALANGNTAKWIYFDSSLSGKTIYLKSPLIVTRPNITIDGRLEGAAVTISHDRNSRAFRLLDFKAGNAVVHGLRFKSNSSGSLIPPFFGAVSFSEGSNYWLDNVSITGFNGTAVSVGNVDAGVRSGNNVTISHLNMHNTDRGILCGTSRFDFKTGYAPDCNITIHSSKLGAKGWNPRAGLGANYHVFNSHIHSFFYNGLSAVSGGKIISENNIVEAGVSSRDPSRSQSSLSDSNGGIGGYIYTSGNEYRGGASTSGTMNPQFPSRPGVLYDYDLVSIFDVESVAGAKESFDCFSDSVFDDFDNGTDFSSANEQLELSSKTVLAQDDSAIIVYSFNRPIEGRIAYSSDENITHISSSLARGYDKKQFHVLRNLDAGTEYEYEIIGTDAFGNEVREFGFFNTEAGLISRCPEGTVQIGDICDFIDDTIDDSDDFDDLDSIFGEFGDDDELDDFGTDGDDNNFDFLDGFFDDEGSDDTIDDDLNTFDETDDDDLEDFEDDFDFSDLEDLEDLDAGDDEDFDLFDLLGE